MPLSPELVISYHFAYFSFLYSTVALDLDSKFWTSEHCIILNLSLFVTSILFSPSHSLGLLVLFAQVHILCWCIWVVAWPWVAAKQSHSHSLHPPQWNRAENRKNESMKTHGLKWRWEKSLICCSGENSLNLTYFITDLGVEKQRQIFKQVGETPFLFPFRGLTSFQPSPSFLHLSSTTTDYTLSLQSGQEFQFKV